MSSQRRVPTIQRIKTVVRWLLIAPIILYILAVQLWDYLRHRPRPNSDNR